MTEWDLQGQLDSDGELVEDAVGEDATDEGSPGGRTDAGEQTDTGEQLP